MYSTNLQLTAGTTRHSPASRGPPQTGLFGNRYLRAEHGCATAHGERRSEDAGGANRFKRVHFPHEMNVEMRPLLPRLKKRRAEARQAEEALRGKAQHTGCHAGEAAAAARRVGKPRKPGAGASNSALAGNGTAVAATLRPPTASKLLAEDRDDARVLADGTVPFRAHASVDQDLRHRIARGLRLFRARRRARGWRCIRGKTRCIAARPRRSV